MKKLKDIFSIQYGNKLDYNKMVPSPVGVNFVSRTSKENGVAGKVLLIEGIRPYDKGLITVALGGSVLSSFVQIDEFYTGQNVAVLMPHKEMHLSQKLYYSLLISSNAFRYSACGREANKTLKDLLLPEVCELPVWVSTVFDSFSFEHAVDAVSKTGITPSLKERQWEKFTYENIFTIERGQSLYKKDLRKGPYPYISATSVNNGISCYCSVFNQTGNAITLAYDGSIGESFYQDSNFFASEKIAVLRLNLKWGIKLNAYIAVFLISLIKKEKFRFNYGLKWSVNSRMRKSIINLPVDISGRPDWVFMEDYIKTLKFSSVLSDSFS
ncbi:restriction endonuclease subunit S [Citrobacter cronae]|uniref:restriction endonuclease subunit S n=1 Tax=Citrobacter cronae TaxID=1748967 RepID=UPI001C11F545|nr:restriction endonuclease subunit S [Citrobacter cronae]MBU5384723.1 restriction endonuclease subunit S [Citrobacter cronae]